MGEEQAIQIQGIIGGILAIVGILLAISGSGLWGRKLKWSIALGLALSGVGLFMLITLFPQYAIGFSVLATLALAFAAFLTIKEADAREQRHRNNELLKEKRDKDERLLNEIIEWADDVAKSAISRQKKDETQLWQTKLEYKVWKAKGTYIKEVTTSSFRDLLSFIENIYCKLDLAILAIEKELEKRTLKEISTGDIKKSENELTEAVESLYKEAAKIKTRDIT